MVSKTSMSLSSESEPITLTNVWGGDPLFCHSSCSDYLRTYKRPCLVSPFSKVLAPRSLSLSGVEWLLRTRLTCSTVGVCVPGFLMKYQGALGSNHPHECRNFAVKREILDMFSVTLSLLYWHLSDCFKEHCNQRRLCSKLHELLFKIVINSFIFIPKVIRGKINNNRLSLM